MLRAKYVSILMQKAIIKGRASGQTLRSLASQFSLSLGAIHGIVKRNRVRGGVFKMPKSGRPRSTTDRLDKIIVRTSKCDPRLTAVDIQRQINTFHGSNIHSATVQRRLRNAGLFGRRPAKKPLVSKKNLKDRLAFAKRHIDWTAEDWRKVVFSDESKFNLFGSDGIQYVRRPINKRYDPKYLLPTVKHGGGSVMLWGAFMYGRVLPIHRINGIMDQYVYKNILSRCLVPHVRQDMPQNWIFQRDNDRKHATPYVSAYLRSKNIQVLQWPSQSPDLNPIEHLWEELARRCQGLHAKNDEQKFEQLKEKWAAIPVEVINHLIDTMPRRCQAVIDAKGYPTKY